MLSCEALVQTNLLLVGEELHCVLVSSRDSKVYFSAVSVRH